MVIKRKHRHARRSTAKISARRKATLRNKAKKIAFSMQAPMRAYHNLEKKIDTTWTKLREDVKRKSRKAIVKGRRDLLLLLGEANYMARECANCLTKKR